MKRGKTMKEREINKKESDNKLKLGKVQKGENDDE
jgi:hypothetical protein